MHDLQNQHLVRYYGMDIRLDGDIIAMHLIMEHVGGGSLRTKIQQFSPMNIEVIAPRLLFQFIMH